MSRVIRRRWISSHEGPSRKDNRGCEYEAYVPDPLVGRNFTIDGEVAADIADAEAAIARLNVEATSLVDTEALARILLRAESVASSRIEGLEIGAQRLLRAEAARVLGDDPSDVTAVEVLGNIDAMVYGIGAVGPGDPVTVEILLEIHRRLLSGTRLEEYGGRFREEQNWIGGSAYNPCSAAFVPPPPELVAGLIVDLVDFANEDSLPAVAQSAIAHAQFETIHPFVDGNGRTGRALVHLILRRRGLAPRVLPPVSLILATWAQDYIDGLTASRYRGPVTSKEASEGINLWIGRFATACKRAVDDAKGWAEFELVPQSIYSLAFLSARPSSRSTAPLRWWDEASSRPMRRFSGWSKRASSSRSPLVDATEPLRHPRSSLPSPFWSVNSPAPRGTPGRASQCGQFHAGSKRSGVGSVI